MLKYFVSLDMLAGMLDAMDYGQRARARAEQTRQFLVLNRLWMVSTLSHRVFNVLNRFCLMFSCFFSRKQCFFFKRTMITRGDRV
jgi:hypothetical protein